MIDKVFNQYDPAWAGHALGSGAGELGPAGCREVCDTMVAYDAYGDMHYNPASFDDLMYANGQFSADLLGIYALDHVWPERFKTTAYQGMRLDVAQALISSYSKTDYIRLWIGGVYSPLWKQVVDTHFVLLLRADGFIADPAGGVIRSILDYGGWGAVKALYHVHCSPLPVVVAAPPPVPLPLPPPTFKIRPADGIAYASLDSAQAAAARYASAHVGELAEVLDEKGQVVGSQFIAPPPAPIPAPPITPPPTPAPAHVQQPDFWAILQTIIIRFLARFSRRRP